MPFLSNTLSASLFPPPSCRLFCPYGCTIIMSPPPFFFLHHVKSALSESFVFSQVWYCHNLESLCTYTLIRAVEYIPFPHQPHSCDVNVPPENQPSRDSGGHVFLKRSHWSSSTVAWELWVWSNIQRSARTAAYSSTVPLSTTRLNSYHGGAKLRGIQIRAISFCASRCPSALW